MARMLLIYHGEEIKAESFGDEKGRVVCYYNAIRRARRLLGIHVQAGGREWGRLPKEFLSSMWRERVTVAGLDPDTLSVINVKRWALTWERLKTDHEYYPAEIENAYQMGWYVDAADELKPWATVIDPQRDPKTGQRRRKKVGIDGQPGADTFISGRFRESLNKGMEF